MGLNAIEICSKLGARVIGTVGSDVKKQWLATNCDLVPSTIVVRPASGRRGERAELRRLLVDAAMAAGAAGVATAEGGGAKTGDTAPPSVPSRVANVGGVKVVVEKQEDEDAGWVDVVLDGIGGVALQSSVDVLARGGRLVHFVSQGQGGGLQQMLTSPPNRAGQRT